MILAPKNPPLRARLGRYNALELMFLLRADWENAMAASINRNCQDHDFYTITFMGRNARCHSVCVECHHNAAHGPPVTV